MDKSNLLIKLHLASWAESSGFTESMGDYDVHSLCGLLVHQKPWKRIHSWSTPDMWQKDQQRDMYYPCMECMSHPDYPLLLLGAI